MLNSRNFAITRGYRPELAPEPPLRRSSSGVILAQRVGVASIRVREVSGRRRVIVRGPLAAGDLRRLERACGPALEHRTAHLEVRIRDASVADESSRLFLEGLVRRGAVLT